MSQNIIVSLLVVALAVSPIQPAQARPIPAAKPSLVARGLESLPAAAQTALQDGLLNAPAASSVSRAAATSAAVPTSLTKPLVVARVQSAYTPGGLVSGTLIITYTVINRLPLDELSGAEVMVKLAPGVTLVSGPAHLTLADGSLSFALGEVGPADGASVAIVVSAPAMSGNLDLGARASASFANQRVMAQTAPARLVSDGYAAFLGQQPEFMFNDVDLLEVAGLVEQDPLRAFDLVRDATRWEAYRGSLRGARGTWWSEAGNALDRSSLLLGVLRTIGVPSRYMRGTLNATQRRALIRQMFEDGASQMGLVSAERQYDPYGDANLLNIANDHWWVEADLGSGWQALDANFRDATIGALFGSGGNVVNTIPEADRHWTKVALTVEQLPALTGPVGKLETFKAFELTLPTAQIAGLPTVIGHFVRSTFDGGAVFYNIRHYYTPFIAVGGIRPDATIYRGDEYFEQITNFPLASQRVTAASYDVMIWGPGVAAQTYKDEVVDRIGKLARRQGGTVTSAGLSSTEPIVRDKHSVSLFVAPTWVPERAVARAMGRLQRQAEQAQEASYAAQQVIPSGLPQTPEQDAAISALDGELALAGLQASIVNGLSAMQDADRATRQLAETGRVKAYYAAPRLLASALDLPEVDAITATATARMNLMRRDIELAPYPGQNPDAVYGVRMAHGIRAMTSEYLTLASTASASDTVKSALGAMDAAMQQGIGYTLLTPDKQDEVRFMDISDDAKARILEALDRGRVVMTPERAPSMRGQAYLAWFEMNLETGEMEDQDEDGNRAAIVEYFSLQEGWKTKKCGPPKDDKPGVPDCKNADTRYAFLGFFSGLIARLYVFALSRLALVDYYLLNQDSPALITYLHQACQKYLGRADWWGQSKGECSAKNIADFFDALVWFVMSFIIRFYREGLGVQCSNKSMFGLLPGGDDEADVFWSGLTMVGVKFWKKCDEFAAKMLTFEIRGLADLYSKLFNFKSIDPFKNLVDEAFLPWLFEILNSNDATDDLAASFGPTFISYDASGIKLRVGGFDHGAAVAGLLVKNVLSRDPEVPPEVAYNVAALPARPVEASRLVAPVVVFGPSTSGVFSTPHVRLRETGSITISGGVLALAGGQVRAGDARVLDGSGAVLQTGDLTVLPGAGGAALNAEGGVVRLISARDVALWAEGAAVRGQAGLTAAHRVLLQASGPLTLTLGVGAVVNAASYTQPVRVVFSAAEWREGHSLAWREAASVAWAGNVGLMQFAALDGALGDASNVGAASVMGWAGSASVVAASGALNVTLSGAGGALVTAAPAWSSDSEWLYVQPNVRSNQAHTYTLAARMDAGQVMHEFDLEGPGATVRVKRQPDQMAADMLRGQLALRDGAQRAVLVVDTSASVPARGPSLSVSVARDELNRHIWGEFPYYAVMGMLYNVAITWTADASGVFDLAVDGLPAGWGVLSRERVVLNKGQSVGVGLIISPSVEGLPLPGTVIPFTVTVNQVGGGLSASGTTVWRAPEGGLPGVIFDPNVRAEVAPTETIMAGLFVFNGGAITDTFALAVGSNVMGRVTATVAGSVTVGASDVARVPVTVAMNAEAGTLVPVVATAGPRGMYTRTATTHMRFAIVPVEDVPLYDRAYELRGPGCKQHLAYATYRLAQALSFYRLSKVPFSYVTAAQERLRNALACFDQTGVFTSTQAISAALTLVPTQTQPLVDALRLLSEQVEQALDYRAELSIAPALSAVRLNQPVTLPVVLAHTGRVSGTFTLVVTDALGVAQTFTPLLAPGERFTRTVVVVPNAKGEYTVSAAASGPAPQIAPRAQARVLAYERLVDILLVKGTPDFVETGSSASALSVDVVNHTPLPQAVTIALTMTQPGGGVHYTALVTRTLMRGVTNVPLGTAAFVNAPAGVYELRAELVGEGREVVGGVSAGAGIRVASSSSPLIVLPGDVTATTWITTERTVFGSGATFSVGVPISGGVDLTVTVNAALHSSNLNPNAGVLVTVPAGIYDIIYITGSVRWHEGGEWYGQLDIVDLSNRKYYILGHGVNAALGSFNPFVGGLPTMEAAGAYHAGRFIRIRVTDTTTLAFYIFDTSLTGSSANVGQITARLVQVDGPDNTLRRRMETAMHHAAPRHALDAIQWDRWSGASTDAHPLGTREQNCNGCHIQAQGIAGLAAINTKLRPSPVDERMMEWLSLRLRDWQFSWGRVDSSGKPFQGTVLPAWAWAEQLRMEANLGRAPSPTVTFALTRALAWVTPQHRLGNLWRTDDDDFPYPLALLYCGAPSSASFSPMTTYFVMTALRVAYDRTGDTAYLSQLTSAAMDVVTRVNWRDTCGGERYPILTAPAMLGLQEAVPVMTDTAQIQAVRTALAAFENDLRVTQQITPGVNANDGGWRQVHSGASGNSVSNASDPYVTAMALYALARQGVRSTDINLLRATEFLLNRQDWNYKSGNTYTSWRVGRWYSMYGRGNSNSPVGSTTWVDFAFPLIYERIGSYSLDVLHDTPAHAWVLTTSFNLPPQSTLTLPEGERRAWFYNQPDTMRYQVISYTSALTGLKPGEVRSLTLGTLVTYTIESGSNRIALPGSYVQAVKLVRITPSMLTVGAGQTARYTVTLSNPLDGAAAYNVTLSGLEEYGAPEAFNVVVPANGQIEQVIEFEVPVWTSARQHAVRAEVNSGQDSDHALLEVVRDVAIGLRPAQQVAVGGQAVTYSVVVSDLSGVGSVVDVVAALGSGAALTLASGLSLPPNGAQALTWTLTAPALAGSYAVRAEARGGRFVPATRGQLDVVLPGLSAALGNATVGAGMPAVLSSTVAQSVAEVFGAELPGATISVQPPAGWQVTQAPTHLAGGQAVRHGDVIVLPPAGTPVGTYDIVLTAVMSGYPQVTAQAVGRVTVLSRGVMVRVSPLTRTVQTGETFDFEVLVTNTGTLADRFVVSPTGLLALQGSLVLEVGGGVIAAQVVDLAPGQTARLWLTGEATEGLPGGAHPVPVQAQSLNDARVRGVDYGWLVVNGRPALRAEITPTYQLVETPNAQAWLLLRNISSVAATPVQITLAGADGASGHVFNAPYGMLLPQGEGATRMALWLPRPGRYVVTATATTPGAVSAAVATATVEYRLAAAMQVADADTYPGQSATLPVSVTNLGTQAMSGLSARVSVPQGPWALNNMSAENGPVTATLSMGIVPAGTTVAGYAIRPLAPLPYGWERITATVELLLNGEVWQVEQARVRARAPDMRGSALLMVGQQEFVHDVLTYTWRLRNTGDADALGARAVVTLPADSRFQWLGVLSVSSGVATWDDVGKRLLWEGNLLAGGDVEIIFKAQASFGLPQGVLASPFEVSHGWRPTHYGVAQYGYPYRVYFMLVRNNAP